MVEIEENKILLSITIPTWNRMEILELSLKNLLPQLVGYENDIELIISDNCSTDNTAEIVKKQQEKYHNFPIIFFQQKENTGYFGNFKKCRELAKGKFFWLLSDNEFVNIGIIPFILRRIKKNVELSCIFLKDWGEYINQSSIKKETYLSRRVTNESLLSEAGYKLTLISAVIIRNNKESDIELFERFMGNSFLGFALFVKSLQCDKNALIISGVSLYSKFTPISFNVFKSFTVDMKECIEYGDEINVLTKEMIHNLMNSIIFNLTRVHYTELKLKGELYGKKIQNLEEINELLYNTFEKYEGYYNYLKPLMNRNKVILKAEVFVKRGLNFIFRRIRKINNEKIFD